MNYYEKIVIIDPNLDDSAVEEMVGKIKSIITDEGGEIYRTDNWGRRKLAYELNKQQKGNYVLLTFKTPPATIKKIEKFCKLHDTIIKFMVVRYTKQKQIEKMVLPPAMADVKPEVKVETETAPVQAEPVGTIETAVKAEDAENV